MHQEALTSESRKVFEHLRPRGFILGGGTGLALQLGHRVSDDFDYFSEKVIPRSLAGRIEKDIAALGLRARPTVNNKDELTILAGDIKFTLLCYPFPTLLPTVTLGSVPAFSVREAAAMKAYTLGRRGTMKDYVDLYFILKSGDTLDSIADLARKKFDEGFDTRLFLEQLVYLDDVEEAPIRFLRDTATKKDLQTFFEEQVRNFPV